MWVVVGVVALVVLVATYVTWLAARIDRLHARSAAAFAALDAHLVRRAAAAAELGEGLGDPAVQAAAKAVLAAHPDDRELAENDLTRALKAAGIGPDQPGEEDDAVIAASRRVALARQVHNDLVRDALGQRRRPIVRLMRL